MPITKEKKAKLVWRQKPGKKTKKIIYKRNDVTGIYMFAVSN